MKQLSLLDLTKKFPDQSTARVWIEEQRWGETRIPDHCPTCAVVDTPVTLTTRPGVFRCKHCMAEFTVRTGTVMERSHIPLNKWIIGIHLFVSSRKGITSVHLSNLLGITQKSAWFMLQRIREACENNGLGMFTGIVEADETYIGVLEKNKHETKENHNGRGSSGKTAVLSVRSRDGKAKGRVVKGTTTATVQSFSNENLTIDSLLICNEFPSYKPWKSPSVVNHSAGEYDNEMIYTNGIESMWSVLKRGIVGVYHFISMKNLQRNVNEFMFRPYRCARSFEVQVSDVFKATVGVKVQYSGVIG